MRKLTKSNLEELAKVMPVLSEEEQKGYVGGNIFYLDRAGHIMETVIADGPDIIRCEPDPSDANKVPTGASFVLPNNVSVSSYVGEGINGDSGEKETYNGVKLEGDGLNMDVFGFLAKNTDVEWGYSTPSEECTGGYMNTTHSENSVKGEVYDDCNIYIHNHRETTDPSEADAAAMNRGFANYDKFFIYYEDQGEGKLKEYSMDDLW